MVKTYIIESTRDFCSWYAEIVGSKGKLANYLKIELGCKHNLKEDIYYSFRKDSSSTRFIDSDFNYRIREIESI